MALEKKTNWNKDKRAKVKSLLESKGAKKLMSSDEEGNDGFISHPYSWESDTWRQIKDSLDAKYIEICPPRSRRLLQKRTRGSVKEQEKPNFPGSWSDSKNLICFEVLKFGRSFNFLGVLGGVICRFIFPI